MPLRDAMARVDALGYNAIDFASFDFWPVDDAFQPGDDVRRAFPYCSEGARHDRVQIRCWKKAPDVDLASSGGHDARFAGRRVFPLRFIVRHYPIRGQAHGERKVFRERQARFLGRERDRGWHVQYASAGKGESFIRDRATLAAYDPDAVRLTLAVRNRDVEALESELQTVRTELAAVRSELQHTAAEWRRKLEEVTALKDALERSHRENTEHAEATRAEAARLRASVDTGVAEIERLRLANADAGRRVTALQQSLSWRWTAPARAVYRLLGGK